MINPGLNDPGFFRGELYRRWREGMRNAPPCGSSIDGSRAFRVEVVVFDGFVADDEGGAVDLLFRGKARDHG